MEMDVKDGYYESEIYSRAFSLPQLRSTGDVEIRIWGEEYIFGYILATVAKKGIVKTCRATIEQDNNQEYQVHKESCSDSGVTFRDEEFREIATSLKFFDQRKVYCTNVIDGWGGIIEGVVNGERFSFRFMNPSECDTPETNEVSRIINLLQPEA